MMEVKPASESLYFCKRTGWWKISKPWRRNLCSTTVLRQRLGFEPRLNHVGSLRVLRFPLPILIPLTAPLSLTIRFYTVFILRVSLNKQYKKRKQQLKKRFNQTGIWPDRFFISLNCLVICSYIPFDVLVLFVPYLNFMYAKFHRELGPFDAETLFSLCPTRARLLRLQKWHMGLSPRTQRRWI
jgi:hypothetical protein